MMTLEEIQQYSHPIKKINIVVNNEESFNRAVATCRIILETDESEVVRFSVFENDGYIPHQKSSNDYFFQLELEREGTNTIYAHFFPADLYEYEGESNIVVNYELSKIIENIKTNNQEQYTVSNNGNNITFSSNYIQTNNFNDNAPYIEIKIPRTSITHKVKENGQLIDKPLMNQDTNTKSYPINVYLDYEYMPTSTDFHRHYFGFEDTETLPQSFNILDGENLNLISGKFNKDTYKLINYGNPTDIRYTLNVDHVKEEIDINFDEVLIKNKSCTWKYNNCENYWIYDSLKSNSSLSVEILLEKDASYILEYYVRDENPAQTDNTIEINSTVLLKENNNQGSNWIYKKIFFKATKEINQLTISKSNIGEMFLYGITLRKMPRYTPTLKYTKNGLYLEENGQTIFKPTSDYYTQNAGVSPEIQITPQPLPKFPSVFSDDINITLNNNIIFIYNINNAFDFTITDEYNNPITRGSVECAITTSSQYDNTNIRQEVLFLGRKNVTSSVTKYDNINFGNLPHRNDYYLRIEYTHPCYDEVIRTYEKINIDEEEINFSTYIKEEDKVSYNEIEDNEYKITSENGFPLHMYTVVRNQLNAVNGGYCTLYINDKLIQNNFINESNGRAYFYLNSNDLPKQYNSVKIEYFKRYNELEAIETFTIVNNYADSDIRPVVPIHIEIIEDGTNKEDINEPYEVQYGDCILFNIRIDDYTIRDFSIQFEKNGSPQIICNENDTPSTIYNITEDTNITDIIISDYYETKPNTDQIVEYTVVTKSLEDSEKYRTYKRNIQIKWYK